MMMNLLNQIDPELIGIELARRKLKYFIQATYPEYKMGWFNEQICNELDQFLEDVRAKKSPRLMLFAPARSGKTEMVSRRFPAFALGKYPDIQMIATSYASDLAMRINRDVQRIIDDPSYVRIFPDSRLSGKNIRATAQGTFLRNADIFEIVDHKGAYRSAGVGGGITGMGGDILLVDDPIKDAEQSESVVYRQKVWDWFTSTLYTRASSGGGILIIMTRWHQDDLAGRLIEAQEKGEGDQWKILSFPAVAEIDEDNRKEGEALQPERYSLDQLKQIKQAVGSRVWLSLYQQRPSAVAGSVFKREHWQTYQPPTSDPQQLKEALGITRTVQAWDTAFKTGTQSDYSVGVTIGLAKNRYYVLDVSRTKVEFPELKVLVNAQYSKWKPHQVLIEDLASGQSLIQELKRSTVIPILKYKPDKDKITKAWSVTPITEASLVYVPDGASWLSDFLDELCGFPTGTKHDDQVDAFVMALSHIARGGQGIFGYTQMLADQKANEFSS